MLCNLLHIWQVNIIVSVSQGDTQLLLLGFSQFSVLQKEALSSGAGALQRDPGI